MQNQGAKFSIEKIQKTYEKEISSIREKSQKEHWSETHKSKVEKLIFEKYAAKEKEVFAERRRAAALQKIEQTAKSKERADDKRRKIILGGALLADPELAETVQYIVKNLKRNQDRAAFGLPPRNQDVEWATGEIQ